MVGVTNILCSCGNQMIFQPIRGSFFCSVCGMRYWIDDGLDKDTEDTYWNDDGMKIEDGDAETPEGI